MKNIARILTSLVILLAAMVIAAQANSYNFITLDVDPLVGYATQGRGINNNGDVVGRYRDPSNAAYSFLYAGSTCTPFHDPDYGQTITYGINDTQQMVGLDIKANGTSNAFLLSGGVYTPLQVGSFYTHAYGINNSSQIVGYYINNSGTGIGFLYAGGSYSDISYGGASETLPRDINESGLITGYYMLSGLYHGFLYQNGVFINSNFMVPGSTQTQPVSINNLGQIVGTYYIGSIAYSFLYDGTNFSSFELIGLTSRAAPEGINDAGQITGAYNDDLGNIHGFLTVPLPPTVWLLGSGLIPLVWWRRRDRLER